MIGEIIGALLEGPLGAVLETAGEILGELLELLFEGATDPLTAQQNKPKNPTGGDLKL